MQDPSLSFTLKSSKEKPRKHLESISEFGYNITRQHPVYSEKSGCRAPAFRSTSVLFTFQWGTSGCAIMLPGPLEITVVWRVSLVLVWKGSSMFSGPHTDKGF